MTVFGGFGYACAVTGSPSATRTASRLGYVDWARGLAVLAMIHTHGMFGWTRAEDRATRVFVLSRLAGGFPAALFLFLAGLSAALVAARERSKGLDAAETRRRALRRGLTVLGYALAFRIVMLASGGFGRWADLLRVDVLNCIGVSLLLLAFALGLARERGRLIACLGLAGAVAFLTPLSWDGTWWRGWPVPLAGYFTGRVADSLFPILPWSAYAAAGAACGLVLARARERGEEGRTLAVLAVGGAAMVPVALLAHLDGPRLYAREDFWYTSPSYTAVKVGVVLVLLGLAALADRLPGPSALRQLGRTSLIVYWAHLEIVYGRWIAPEARGALSVEEATWGVVLLAAAMLLLSLARTSLGGGPSGAGGAERVRPEMQAPPAITPAAAPPGGRTA